MTLGIERDWIEDLLTVDPEDATLQLGEAQDFYKEISQDTL